MDGVVAGCTVVYVMLHGISSKYICRCVDRDPASPLLVLPELASRCGSCASVVASRALLLCDRLVLCESLLGDATD